MRSLRAPRARLVPVLAVSAALAACASSTPPAAGDTCSVFFGSPVAQTGLTSAQCAPSCSCAGATFTPPTYDAAFIARLVSDWAIETPFPEVTTDPYLEAPPATDPDAMVCGVLPVGPAGAVPRTYRLVTYASEAAALAAGAKVTHFGHCAVCSTLEDLAVYVRENDLTAKVRNCGLNGLTPATFDQDLACLRGLGFTLPCAQVWAYNTQNTRNHCLSECLPALTAAYNLPDGSLNPCLQCDETQSGPVFKWKAGRTRRNCGLPNSICRPCSEVRPLVHAY
ncbi:MAG TPA: hypothetical protein VFM45_03540 [Anaeromyxobacteraceae bacterium]|nr:hypothetical protein [Anaeromyxobacteraceae bacterium]